MPTDFVNCVNNGGKVVTKNLKGNKYIRICYDKDGTSHSGEVKTRKKKSKGYYKHNKNKKHFKNKIKRSKALVEDLLRLRDHFNANYHNV